jgi:alpha-glucuronidase
VGKTSPLDFETAECTNPLDGVLHENYGGEVVVGKSFLMSWVSNWERWLSFDNGHGAAGHELNGDIVTLMLGVLMIGTGPAWFSTPLNQVNLYGFGRLAWNTSLTHEAIYEEWATLTFGSALQNSVLPMISTSETIANDLGIYHGYRGVWYEFEEDGSFRTPNSVKHVLTKKAIGTTSSLARELFSAPWGYSKLVQNLYHNRTDPRTEAVLLEFGTVPTSYKLTDGTSIEEDMLARPQRGAKAAAALVLQWTGLQSMVTDALGLGYWNYTLNQLLSFAQEASSQVTKIQIAVHKMK